MAGEPIDMNEKQNLKTWIKLKVSEIILQAIVVVFSILLALAVDEWRSTKAQKELAVQAYNSIFSELKENQKELISGITENDSILAVIVRQLRSKTPRKEGIPFSLVQLSSAAWQTAQGTQALQLIDFPRLIKIAQVYELQSQYNMGQSKFLNELGESWLGDGDANRRMVLRKGGIQLATICEIGHGLSRQYSSILNDTTEAGIAK
jgi:hypothetical protein